MWHFNAELLICYLCNMNTAISGSNKNKIQSKHIYQKPSSIITIQFYPSIYSNLSIYLLQSIHLSNQIYPSIYSNLSIYLLKSIHIYSNLSILSTQIYPSVYSNLSIYPLRFIFHLSTEGLRFISIYLPRYILSIYLPRYIFIYLSDVYYTIHSHFKPDLCPSAEKSSRFLSNYLSIFYSYILITSILLHVSKL